MTPPAVELEIQPLTVGPFAENTYIVSRPGSDEALLVDPGDEPELLLEALESRSLRVANIWLTHAHIDHVGALAAMKRATGAPISMHVAEKDWPTNAIRCGAAMFGLPFETQAADAFHADGDTLSALGLSWRVLHVPGHSPGLCAFHCAEAGIALVGDLIFRGSVGRVDLPFGDARAMAESLRRFCAEVPDETVLFNGHGPETTLGAERRSNPYIRAALAGA